VLGEVLAHCSGCSQGQRATANLQIWRASTVSNALSALKDRQLGLVAAKPRSRDYVIAQLLPAQNNLSGFLNAELAP
jgi:hypothetical protein